MSSSTARQILRDTFGYASFRGAQQAIVEHVAAGGDALVQDQVDVPQQLGVLKKTALAISASSIWQHALPHKRRART